MLSQVDQVPENSSLITAMTMGSAPYQHLQNLKMKTFFPGGSLRKAFASGTIDALRYPLSQVPSLFENNALHADILFLQVSQADSKGFHSLGLSVDYMPAVMTQKPVIVAEINPQMPRTSGSNLLHSSEIDWFIDVDYTPLTVSPVLPQAIEQTIAKFIASLVEDGDTLQLGIGALPDATAGLLTHHKNLGLHSGILSDAVQPLIEQGVVTQNDGSGRWRGKCVTTMAAGTAEFYRFLHDNNAIEFHPCALTHAPETLAKVDKLTAINSALQIDLSGNATAESVGGRRISMPGGLADFATGAACAPKGKSILSLRATNRDGTKSNLVPSLSQDTIKTLDSNQIDYVVTEFGIANISNTNAADRAKALVEIAHPDHREGLLKEAHEIGR